MPFDWRRLLGVGGGNSGPDTSGMNPYQAQVQRMVTPQPSQGNRLMAAGLAGLGGDNNQQGPPQGQPPPFQSFQGGLQGLGQPIQFGNRPPPAPTPTAPIAAPNISTNMPGSPMAMNMGGGMAGTPRSTRPVDPNDPYNLNARNRMLGLA